jgi:UDP-N-acetylmuramoyl-L-alanyl-D-glutamate--2,6-diaminopimelate ligase
MHRLDELQFDVGILTNMSRDHLDFHGTWENYRQAKLMLFESDRLSGTAVINADDPEADLFLRHTKRPSLTYGLSSNSDFSAMQIQLRADGTTFHLQSPEGRLRSAHRSHWTIQCLQHARDHCRRLRLGIAGEENC